MKKSKDIIGEVGCFSLLIFLFFSGGLLFVGQETSISTGVFVGLVMFMLGFLILGVVLVMLAGKNGKK